MKPFIITVGKETPDLHASIRVALGHLTVEGQNIRDSYLGTPNVSRRRKQIISKLLNSVVQHGAIHPDQKVDLLVLPEVSVPHRFVSFITRWSRDHQIGIVCGLEHRIDAASNAWNELLAVLPYRKSDGTKECAPIRRLKKHYSPEEEFQLNGNHLLIPKNPTQSKYQLFRWRGASFAIYNCYELTSIEDRSIFKGKVDFIICSEYNPDIHYFSNIVESAALDLHCFVVQVNSAQFGDSRVVCPSPTEKDKRNPLRIKGGDNQTFLTMKLPLQSLRAFQMKKYSLQKGHPDYKPSPPDLAIADVRARIRLGKKKKDV